VNIIDQYIKQIEIDLQIDEFNIKDVSMKVPGKKHFWVCKLITHKKKLLELKAERFKLKQEITRQIMEKSPVKLTLPIAEKSAYQHHQMIKLQLQIDEEEIIIEFLEKAEKNFSAITWDISNIIKIMQMETL
jgi:hypothetical protein